MKDKKYRKVRDHYHDKEEYRGAKHSISNFKNRAPETITIVFHNGSNYYYNFIRKELAEEFLKKLLV